MAAGDYPLFSCPFSSLPFPDFHHPIFSFLDRFYFIVLSATLFSTQHLHSKKSPEVRIDSMSLYDRGTGAFTSFYFEILIISFQERIICI